MKRLDPVGAQLLLPAFPVVRDNVFLVAHEVLNRRLAPEREINAEEFARTPTRKSERRLAQRFARNRTGVDTRAANLAEFFYKRDLLPENCGGVSSADASRSAPGDPAVPEAPSAEALLPGTASADRAAPSVDEGRAEASSGRVGVWVMPHSRPDPSSGAKPFPVRTGLNRVRTAGFRAGRGSAG